MAEWLYETVTTNFDFTREVCEQARFQIAYCRFDLCLRRTCATSIRGLIKELYPADFSDDAPTLIGQYADWLLAVLVAAHPEPAWIYSAIGPICGRALKRQEERATMDRSTRDSIGAHVNRSLLDVFILSLFDRGLETAYDLQRHAGVSLGSSTPALKRLQAAGLLKRTVQVGSSKRLRHGFEITATGRKLVRGTWISLLKDQPPSDFDSILRVVDVAQHYEAKVADIAAFLTAASSERWSSTRSGRTSFRKTRGPLGIMATREAWDATRVKAEAKFLAEFAKSLTQKALRATKRSSPTPQVDFAVAQKAKRAF
jgi:DNA-binding PadR family transcriptional regulator